MEWMTPTVCSSGPQEGGGKQMLPVQRHSGRLRWVTPFGWSCFLSVCLSVCLVLCPTRLFGMSSLFINPPSPTSLFPHPSLPSPLSPIPTLSSLIPTFSPSPYHYPPSLTHPYLSLLPSLSYPYLSSLPHPYPLLPPPSLPSFPPLSLPSLSHP